jgi:hypothetical protein
MTSFYVHSINTLTNNSYNNTQADSTICSTVCLTGESHRRAKYGKRDGEHAVCSLDLPVDILRTSTTIPPGFSRRTDA